MSHRILVIEDEPDIAAIVVDYLRHAGYTVEHQAEGRAALASMLAAPPDLDAEGPPAYPASTPLASHGWTPLPLTALPFRSIVAGSRNDHLASFTAVTRMAENWGAELLDLGDVGHLNPAAGFGHWQQAEALILQLDS